MEKNERERKIIERRVSPDLTGRNSEQIPLLFIQLSRYLIQDKIPLLHQRYILYR